MEKLSFVMLADMIYQKNKIIILILLLSGVSTAQKNFSVVLKVGTADYNISSGGFAGGGPYYTFWNDGYHISGGIEFSLNNSFTFQGVGEYSSFKFNTDNAYLEKVNDAINQVFDLMGNIKWNLGIFYFIGGVGFSAQIGDEVKYLEKNEYHDATTLYPSRNKFVFAGLLGLGFEINVYNKISLIAEADIRMREYAGITALLGVKYKL